MQTQRQEIMQVDCGYSGGVAEGAPAAGGSQQACRQVVLGIL